MDKYPDKAISERAIRRFQQILGLLNAWLIVVAALFVLAIGDRIGSWSLPWAGVVHNWLIFGLGILAFWRLLVLQRLIEQKAYRTDPEQGTIQ